MRLSVQIFGGGMTENAKTIYFDCGNIPLGMPNDKCALWMLNSAMERIGARLPKQVSQTQRHD
jgi:hypothetical protein